MLTRRDFARLAALIPALAVPAVAAKPKTIRLRDIEREYDPQLGYMGRGVPISSEQLAGLDTTGYRLFLLPDSSELRHSDYTCYGRDGLPNGLVWRGYIRVEDGKHYVVALEYRANRAQRRRILDAPIYSSISGVPTRKRFRDCLIDPESWVNA